MSFAFRWPLETAGRLVSHTLWSFQNPFLALFVPPTFCGLVQVYKYYVTLSCMICSNELRNESRLHATVTDQ